jgi:hypothetical protein
LDTPTEVQTVSDQQAPVDKNKQIQNLLTEKNVKIDKYNERSYGPYEVAYSVNGQDFMAVSPRPFGWGFTIEWAAAEVLKDAIEKNDTQLDNSLISFFGQDIIDELRKIVRS